MKHFYALLLFVFCATATLFAQVPEKKITMHRSNVPLSEVMDNIEKSTGYTFFYDAEDVNVAQKVSLNCDNESLTTALRRMLAPLKLSFEITSSQIALFAQTNSVAKSVTAKGVVSDDKGEPIIGANVMIQGTNVGVTTNVDGQFEIKTTVDATLHISYIGYKDATVKVKSEAPVKVQLTADNIAMEDVVVVAYGVQKKANLSGSVAQVDKKQLDNRPIQNLSSGLQGLLPGVTITGTNGAPGMDGGQIRVRGTGTLNNSSPYILIDGVETSTMSSIDPNDIASISVLKDASSAAIYGSKAANGVILITTKRGATGKTRVSYSGYVSFQSPTELVDRMGSYEYATEYNALLEADGKKPRFDADEIRKFKDGNDPLYPNTDWMDLIYKTGVQHRHNVSVTGGNEFVRYMGSVGYLHQTGILPNAGREQVNARTNLDMKISSRLSAKLNLSYIKNDYSDPSSAFYGGSSYQIIRQANKIAPWIVARYPDGTWGTISDGSPVAWLDSGLKVNRKNQNISGSASLDYKLLDCLTATVTGAYVSNVQDYDYFQKFIQYNANKASEPSYLDWRDYKWNRTNFDALLNFDKSFGAHNLKALLGWHTEEYNYKYMKMYRKNFPNDDLSDMNAGDVSTQTNEGFTRKLTMLSWFGRINYDYAGKYFLEANIRADASSRFADGHRWGYFPSFSAAWRISEEKFMGSAQRWLSNLKIRGSWGKLGNQEALSDYYPAINTYDLSASYPFGGNLNVGYFQSSYRLEDITWEKASTWGVAVDFGLWNNKFTGTIEYYNRKTTGILMEVSVPAEFALKPYMDNVGSMRNSGVEVNLGYQNRWNNWTFGVNANFAYNKNRILDLGYNVDYLVKDGNHRQTVGCPMWGYYLYQSDGFFNSQEEATAYEKKYGNPFGAGGFKAGDIRFKDVTGDGKLDGNDRVMCDSTEPVYTFGFNINVGWKGIDLSMMFNGAAKVKRYFMDELYGTFSGDVGHPATVWRDSWSESNHHATMPRKCIDLNSPSFKAPSDFWLEDTSYLRLKNLQIGYTFPKKWMAKLGIEKARIYYSAENLFTIDNMRVNVDPECTNERGAVYPLLRTHALGLNVTF